MNGVLEKRRSSFPVGERERERERNERMMKDKDSSSKSKREKMERERENKLCHHRFQEEEALSFFVCSCEARLAKKEMKE
jgi:hypothetical protein